jgi:hypothetical protein
VRGHADIPEDTLPGDADGFPLSAMFVSEDFDPSMVQAELWLPSRTGRSFPMSNGQREPSSGPVSLQVTAPRLRRGEEVREAYGRLNIYYLNNLLQSATVRVSVGRRRGVRARRRNEINVDFALSGAYQEVPERVAPRHVSITVNQDGSQRHRLVVMAEIADTATARCPPQGWTPYDPQGAADLLRRARESLAQCGYALDREFRPVSDANGQPKVGIDLLTNRRDKRSFEADLYRLAAAGRELWVSAFDDVRSPDGACKAAEWTRDLRLRLERSRLIQIARPDLLQYVYPWALVYQYDLYKAAETWRSCRVLEEWSPEGVREPDSGGVPDRCPYEDEHDDDVVCPYGFWGLRHIIEEPLVNVDELGDAIRLVHTSTNVGLGPAITRDPTLIAAIEGHLGRIGSMPGLHLLAAATTWKEVRDMLRSPEIAYFLCHGNRDAEGRAYLGIGTDGRIYATDLSQWFASPRRGPDLDAWRACSPLVLINGCHTGALRPGEITSFVKSFAGMNVGGVLATEVSVLLPVAVEFAESFLRRVLAPNPEPLGKALRDARWQLANKGNLLGLAYTLHGMADLRVVRDVGGTAADSLTAAAQSFQAMRSTVRPPTAPAPP